MQWKGNEGLLELCNSHAKYLHKDKYKVTKRIGLIFQVFPWKCQFEDLLCQFSESRERLGPDPTLTSFQGVLEASNHTGSRIGSWCDPCGRRWQAPIRGRHDVQDLLENKLVSLQSKGLSRVFSSTTVQKNQFVSDQPSSQSNSHIHTWPQGKP